MTKINQGGYTTQGVWLRRDHAHGSISAKVWNGGHSFAHIHVEDKK